MATSIFNNTYQSAQTWDMQGAAIVFSASTKSTGGAGAQKRADNLTALIVQSLSLSYQRSVNKIYPINISQAIQLIGIPEGSMSMGLIWGPSNALKEFIDKYKDDCMDTNEARKAKTITIYPYGRKCKSTTANDMTGTLIVVGPAISGIGITIQAAQGNAMPVMASMTLTFIDLQIDDSAAEENKNNVAMNYTPPGQNTPRQA